MNLLNWITNNYIEVIGAVTGIIYVFFEIRQKIWLWPLGIITSALYIWIFFVSKFYADAGLQVYYLLISVYGWYWWVKGAGEGRSVERRAESGEHIEPDPLLGGARGGSVRSVERKAESVELTETDPLLGGARGGLIESVERRAESGEEKSGELIITRLKPKTGLILTLVFAALFAIMWYILNNFTDSPVPGWDSFLTALSIVATWMLARKILEHWILWIVVDIVSIFVYATKGLYPTVVLFIVYSVMAFVGLYAWKRDYIIEAGEVDIIEAGANL